MRQFAPPEAARAGDDPRRYCRLIGHVLDLAYRDLPRPDFVHGILTSIAADLACDRIELRQVERRNLLRWQRDGEQGRNAYVAVPARVGDRGLPVLGLDEDGVLQNLYDAMTYGDGADTEIAALAGVVVRGERGGVSLERPPVTEGVRIPRQHSARDRAAAHDKKTGPLEADDGIRSLAALPFERNEGRWGVIILGSRKAGHFSPEGMSFLEELARAVGLALAHREVRRDLRERVKEMSCLYGMARVAADPDLTLDEVLGRCVRLLPPAWLYAQDAVARVTLDGNTQTSGDYPENGQRLCEPIVVESRERGSVEVAYRVAKPERDDGPFLAEERRLLATVAHELGRLIEQRRIAREVHGLKDQLLHADRLATIGQVASGVVHELNEPLGGILGFAQLIKKEPELPPQVRQDIDRIVAAALHSREVVRRLMLFSRRTPPRCDRINLNEIISEGLYFLESRCERVGIELVRELQPGLPEISGDPSQLYQVLVNLVVNAIQASDAGGRVTIATEGCADGIIMRVEDTGAGMSEEVRRRVLEPFFTTKGIDEGTGLGLAVVDGIVRAHGGTIEIASEEKRGSRFTIRLPLERRKGMQGKVYGHG